MPLLSEHHPLREG
jgi:hypothetical protein